eukprot:1267039-Pleurochrysis_carterae.AAC.2
MNAASSASRRWRKPDFNCCTDCLNLSDCALHPAVAGQHAAHIVKHIQADHRPHHLAFCMHSRCDQAEFYSRMRDSRSPYLDSVAIGALSGGTES